MEKIKKFLIDSDILIDFLRGKKQIKDLLLKLKSEGELIISVVNIVEIYSGKEIKNPKKKKIIDKFLFEFKIAPLEEDLAKKAGEIKLNYQLPFADAIIAASVFGLKAVLVTKNIKHFSKVKGLKIYSEK